ncbi:MAG: homocysteine S-methyltransferase family protein [Kiloniellales bacterium]|nr:homocysteine S-methyltransferase family protein [Kiloniellales bacterium]
MIKDLIILDGGMGRELQERGLIAVRSIWSAAALIDHPKVVRDVHEAFIAAGAEVITTNSYGVVPSLLAVEQMEDRLPELLAAACRLAQEAREAGGKDVRIAGSLPPLETSYRPDLIGDEETLLRQYLEIAKHLKANGVDLLLGETLTTSREARAAARAADCVGLPAWISWSLEDDANGLLRSGERLKEAVAALAGLAVDALLFNCCSVEAVSAAIPRLRELTGLPIGAYANNFIPLPKNYEMGDGASEGGGHPLRKDLPISGYIGHAKRWRADGASIIGGCCGIGPPYIRALALELT